MEAQNNNTKHTTINRDAGGEFAAEKDENNTTISRWGWIIQQKINNKFNPLGQSSWPQSIENRHNNQPDRIRDSNSNE